MNKDRKFTKYIIWIQIFNVRQYVKILLLFISTGYPSTLRHRADKDNKDSVDKLVTENSSKYLEDEIEYGRQHEQHLTPILYNVDDKIWVLKV